MPNKSLQITQLELETLLQPILEEIKLENFETITSGFYLTGASISCICTHDSLDPDQAYKNPALLKDNLEGTIARLITTRIMLEKLKFFDNKPKP